MSHPDTACCVPRMGGRPPSRPGEQGACELGLEEYETSQDDTIDINFGGWASTGKTLVTGALAGGTYRIGCYYLCGPYDDNDQCAWRVRLDGASNVWPTTHVQSHWRDDERVPHYRTRYITLIPGPHTFDLQSTALSSPAATYEAMFELWKDPPSVSGQSVCPCLHARQVETDVHVVGGRILTDRTLMTPVLEAGVYRLEVSYSHSRLAGSAAEVNVDLDGGGDIFPRNTQEGFPIDNDAPRTLVRELSLGAGAHIFTLTLNTTSSTTISLGETDWVLHRVDGT